LYFSPSTGSSKLCICQNGELAFLSQIDPFRLEIFFDLSLIVWSGMSAMTASGSKSFAPRQLHNATQPASPAKTSLHKHSNKKRKTGKEKEDVNAREEVQDEWDHSKAGTEDWQWVSLTDSSASKHPPIFTKDGRYFLGQVIFCFL
jgi:hypothetical protein